MRSLNIYSSYEVLGLILPHSELLKFQYTNANIAATFVDFYGRNSGL